MKAAGWKAMRPFHRTLLNPVNKMRYASRAERYLEIGPGRSRIPGFETFNIVSGSNVDYVGDASKALPFPDRSFNGIYASHIIEHVPWYSVAGTLSEWARTLKPGGYLEVWTPNGLQVARAFVEAEDASSTDFHSDGWWRFNPEKDPCKWASGRFFSYGDGQGTPGHPNWHKAAFSPRYLMKLFAEAGLTEIRQMERSEVRAYDHGWINLGVRGIKPR